MSAGNVYSPSRLAAWLLVLCLALTYGFAAADRNSINLLAEPISADLSLRDSELGIAAGIAFGALYVVAAPVFGWLSDRVSRKLVLTTGVLIWCIMTMLCATATDFFSLVLFRMGVGLGEAALIPAAYPLIAEAVPRRRVGLATSLFVLGSLVGGALAAIGGAQLLKYPTLAATVAFSVGQPEAAWRGVFLVLGAAGLVLIPLILMQRLPTVLGQESTSPSETRLHRSMRMYGGLFIGFAASAVVVFSINTWAVVLLSRRFALDTASAGSMFGSISLVCGLVGAIGAGLISDTLARRGVHAAHFKCVLLGASLTIPAAIAFPLSNQLWGVQTTLAFVILLTTFVATLAPTVLQLVTPQALRGRLAAAYLVTVNVVGLGLGPYLTGILADHIFGAKGIHLAVTSVTAMAGPIAVLGFYLAWPAYKRLVD